MIAWLLLVLAACWVLTAMEEAGAAAVAEQVLAISLIWWLWS